MKAARTRALNRKHAGTAKHASTAKHTGTATRKAPTAHQPTAKVVHLAPKVAKARAWSPDETVACCSARAVAESLRLALGVPVSHDDVLALYWLVADDPDAGASILATLEAAQRWGGTAGQDLNLQAVSLSAVPGIPRRRTSLILGLHLPWGEPHAVTYDPRDGAWWSWGEPHSPADFPGAVIEEAWAVTWA